jgi:hypothetical protein
MSGSRWCRSEASSNEIVEMVRVGGHHDAHGTGVDVSLSSAPEDVVAIPGLLRENDL